MFVQNQSAMSPAANVFMALTDADYQYSKGQVIMLRGDDLKGIVSINAVFYIKTADFTTGTNFTLGTILDGLCRPNCNISVPGIEILTGSLYSDVVGDPFAGTQELDKVSIMIQPNGNISVYIKTVNTSSILSSVNYLIIPVSVSFTKLIEEVILP